MKRFVLPALLIAVVLAAAGAGAVWYLAQEEESDAGCSSCTLRHQNLRDRLEE